MRSFDLLVAAFALLQLVRYARGALLFVVPAVRVSGEAADSPPSSARARAREQLEALGFTRLGVLHQRGPLGALTAASDTYASAAAATAFADVTEARPGPRVVFFTPFTGGAAVVTENARRRSISTSSVLAGGLPDAPLSDVHAAHQVAVRRFSQRHGAPAVTPDLAGRVAAARAWYDGPGRREIRTTHAAAFGIALLAAAILASAVNVMLHRAT